MKMAYLVLRAFGVNNIYLLSSLAGQVFTAPIGMVFFVLCFAMVLSLDMAESERRMMEAERQIEEIHERYNAIMAAQSAEQEPPKPIALTDYGLSKRKIDVTRLLIDGKAKKEIAALLDISMGTVNT